MKFNWGVFILSWVAILNAAGAGYSAGKGDIGAALVLELVAVFGFVLVVIFATVCKPKEKGAGR